MQLPYLLLMQVPNPNLDVLFVGVLGIESRVADSTVEEVVSLVDLHVRLEIGQPGEGLAAQLTLQSVLQLAMLLETGHVGKQLVAVGAPEVLCIGMVLAHVLFVLV